MPIPSRPTSSPLLARLAASRLIKRALHQWRGLLQRPFPRLVAHFAATIVQTGADSGASDLNFGIGGLLALLAAPGAFFSLMLFPKYSSFLRWLRGHPRFDVYWASLPDKYFFIVFSMAITGLVIVIKWDRILPGRQDYSNLAPLPLRSRTIFLANLCAVLLLAALFAVDVNLVSSVMMPGVVLSEKGTFKELFVFIAIHAFSVLLASAFTFFACFACIAILMSALPARTFRTASLFIRMAIVVSLIALLCTSFAVLPAVQHLPTHPESPVRYLPPVWYLALYQSLQGKSNPALDALARIGLEAAAAAFALALLFCALSYRRRFLRIPESSDARQGARRWNLRQLSHAFDRCFVRNPFERASYRFTLRALLRSETHCILFGAFAGLGLVLGSQMAMSAAPHPQSDSLPSLELLAAPLALAYFTALGLRFVFEVPAALGSNWVYKLILGECQQGVAAAARKIMLTFLIPGIIVPVLIAYSWAWGWRLGAIHAAYSLAISVVLIEILLLRFRKIPFTCTLPPFENNAILIAFICFLGFFAFTDAAAAAELWMLRRPVFFLAVPIFLFLCWDVLRRIKRDTPDVDLTILYEETGATEVQTLNLRPLG